MHLRGKGRAEQRGRMRGRAEGRGAQRIRGQGWGVKERGRGEVGTDAGWGGREGCTENKGPGVGH